MGTDKSCSFDIQKYLQFDYWSCCCVPFPTLYILVSLVYTYWCSRRGLLTQKKAGFSCMYGLSVRKIHVRSQNFCQKCSKSVKLCSWNWRLKRRKLKWFGIHGLSIIWVRNWNMCGGYLLELNFWLLDVVRGIFRSHFYHASKSRLALPSIQNSNGLLWKQYTICFFSWL